MWQGNNMISRVQDRSSHVRLGLFLKMVACKKLAIRIACALISTNFSPISWVQIDREEAFFWNEAMLADTVVYNSSPNSLLLFHWLSVIADVVFSQNTFYTAGFWIADRSRYLACQISHGCRRFSQIASLLIHTVWLSLAWTSTDLPVISGICRRFLKTCRRAKNWAKIVQSERGFT